MGYSTAYSLATDYELSLEDAISIHFSSNCYPPIPQYMVQSAVAAVVAVSAGDYDEVIELPHGVTYKGSEFVDAATFVDAHRLDAFILEDVEGDC
jgi:hypothetical protein